MTVIEHTVPFFLPLRELESDLLSSNAIVSSHRIISFCHMNYVHSSICLYVLFFSQKFIDHLEEILQAYIDRREQVSIN
jgi:centromere protein O